MLTRKTLTITGLALLALMTVIALGYAGYLWNQARTHRLACERVQQLSKEIEARHKLAVDQYFKNRPANSMTEVWTFPPDPMATPGYYAELARCAKG